MTGPKSLKDWIRYLHAAAAVPKGHADYPEAQAAVQQALQRIGELNTAASQNDPEAQPTSSDLGPDASARIGAGEGLAGTGGALLGARAGMPFGPLGIAAGGLIGAYGGSKLTKPLTELLASAPASDVKTQWDATVNAHPLEHILAELATGAATGYGVSKLGKVVGLARKASEAAKAARAVKAAARVPTLESVYAGVAPKAAPLPTAPFPTSPAPLSPAIDIPEGDVPTIIRKATTAAKAAKGRPGHPIWYGPKSFTRSPEVVASPHVLGGAEQVDQILRTTPYAQLRTMLEGQATKPGIREAILRELQRRGITGEGLLPPR